MSFTVELAVGHTAGLTLSIIMRINVCLTAGIPGGPDLSPGIIRGFISPHSKHSIPTNHCTLKQVTYHRSVPWPSAKSVGKSNSISRLEIC